MDCTPLAQSLPRQYNQLIVVLMGHKPFSINTHSTHQSRNNKTQIKRLVKNNNKQNDQPTDRFIYIHNLNIK